MKGFATTVLECMTFILFCSIIVLGGEIIGNISIYLYININNNNRFYVTFWLSFISFLFIYIYEFFFHFFISLNPKSKLLSIYFYHIFFLNFLLKAYNQDLVSYILISIIAVPFCFSTLIFFSFILSFLAKNKK